MNLESNVERLLEQRYYLPGESWPQLVDRVVDYICTDEPKKYTETVRQQILDRVWLPNSPCLVNSGRKNGGIMACFVVGPDEDTLEHHGYTLVDIASVGKRGGGCGFSGVNIRPAGSLVGGSAHDTGQGVAYGPNWWAIQVSSYLNGITQGGFRKMALMYSLNADHKDIDAFIDLKQVPDEEYGYNFNQSIMANDAWMISAIDTDDPYSEQARLLHKIAENSWNNGEPGLLFHTAINTKSPYKTCACGTNNKEIQDYYGIITTNPCGEQPLPSYGSCNLGSINVSHDIFFSKKGYGFDKLEEIARDVTRFLDNVGTKNIFPNKKFEGWYADHRPIGVGIMGFADAMLKLGVHYGRHESKDLLRSIMKVIKFASYDESARLGEKRGIPTHCSTVGRRNITTTTVAPTGSISHIANCSSGIEPIFADSYMRRDERGEEYLYNHPMASSPHFVSSINSDPAKTPTWQQHVEIQAKAQEQCDSGVSKTINFPEEATVADVKNAMIYAWSLGCKGITGYRNNSRNRQVLNHTTPTEEDQEILECVTGVCDI